MNVSESHGLLPSVVGFAVSTALLWIGAEVFAAARSRAKSAMRRLQACALVVAGCGVWWPGPRRRGERCLPSPASRS